MPLVRQSILALFVFLPLLLVLAWLAAHIDNTKQQWSNEYQRRPAVELHSYEPGQKNPKAPSVSPLQSSKTTKRTENNDHSLDASDHDDGSNSPAPNVDASRREKLLQQGASKSNFRLEEAEDEVDCTALCQPMTEALDEGRLSYARYLAFNIQKQHPLQCTQTVADLYTQHADAFLAQRPPAIPLSRIAVHASPDQFCPPPRDAFDCWIPGHDDESGMDLEDASTLVLSKWDTCCSQIARSASTQQSIIVQKECYHISPTTLQRQRLCCGLYRGSLSYLRLPALQEMSMNIRLMTSPVDAYEFTIQQEGFLRKYDTAGVLWPTAYLLSMCIADPLYCGIPELLEAVKTAQETVVSIELGAGIGVPSLAMSRLLTQHNLAVFPPEDEPKQKRPGTTTTPRVLATDRAMHALAMTALNSQAAGAPLLVTHIEDHTDLIQLKEVTEHTVGTMNGGFSIVLGSALETLFDFKTRDPRHKLWKVLDTLVDPYNPNAIAILSHVVGDVVPPSAGGAFELVRIVSGNHFDMKTRSGDDSDFQISVYRRTVANNADFEL